MTDEKRQGERVPVGLRVRLRYPDMGAFVSGYAANISRNGVFLERVAARPIDTLVRFELLLADGSVALRGEGRVLWSRAEGERPGVAVRFTKLDSRSKQLVDELVAGARAGRVSIAPVAARSLLASTPPRASRGPEPPAQRPPDPRREPAPRERRSVEDLERELAELERTTEPGPRTSRPNVRVTQPGGRRSVAELSDELERLSTEVPSASQPGRASAPDAPRAAPSHSGRAPVAHRVAPSPPSEQRAPAPAEPTETAPVRPPLIPAAPVAARAARAGERVSAAPTGSRELSSEPEILDEADLLEIDAEAVDVTIPQPPPMPSNVSGAAARPAEDDLPDIDLGDGNEPTTVMNVATTRAALEAAAAARSAPDGAQEQGVDAAHPADGSGAAPGRGLLRKLFNR